MIVQSLPFVILLEGGDFTGIVVAIVSMMIIASIVISLVVAAISKFIYEAKGDRKMSRGNFWRVVLLCLAICGLISGFVCGGL